MKILQIAKYTVAILVATVLLYSCANRGAGPQGGPKDENPPVLQGCKPAMGSTNVDTLIKKIVFDFNENIAIKDAHKFVMVSPPSKSRPIVKAVGHSVQTSFDEPLKPNTTYTIYYGDAITDNNEGNPLKDFTYVFSTGDHVDTLSFDGYVLNALTLAAMPEIIVGIYKEGQDSLFTSKTFFRAAKTNDDGYFSMRNLPEGRYTLYALNDASSDYYYAQKSGGEVAFNDDPIVLGTGHSKDSTALILRLFKEVKNQEYFKKSLHPTREQFMLVFGYKPTMIPELKLVDSDYDISNSFIMEKGQRADSLIYWVTDSTLLQNDTLRLQMKYLRTDSLGQLVPEVDTLRLSVPKKREIRRKKDDDKVKEKAPVLALAHNIKETMEVPDTITINFSQPIGSIIEDSISLTIKVDTLFNPIPFRLEFPDTKCRREMKVIYEKSFGETYKFRMDSASVLSIYGVPNPVFYKTFKIRPLEEYANLYIRFTENPDHAVIELVDNTDAVKYVSILEDNEVTFQDIKPGTYFVRMYIDENSNGKWDTGDVHKRIQPETMYYMPEKVQLPANWDVEQLWDYKSFSLLNQRPQELRPKKEENK